MIKSRRREPERIAIPMPPELIKRIDEYRWSERIASRAEAIRELIDDSLKRHERRPRPPRPEDDSE